MIRKDNMTPKTFDELHKLVMAIFPEAMLGEDYEGQIVIYTNLTIDQSSDNEDLISLSHL